MMIFTRHHRTAIQLVLAGAILATALPALAAPPGKEKDKKGEKDKESDFPKFEEVTKDMEVKEGFWKLYYDQKEDKLLAQIPKDKLEEQFLAATSIAGGSFFAGWQWSDGVVYFERMNKRLVLTEVDPRFVREKKYEVDDIIGRTYTDRIIRAVDIVTEAPNGDPLIDLADFCKSDFTGLGQVLGGGIDASLSRFSKIKAFPDNVELGVELAVMSGRSGGGTKATVHYSLAAIPKTGYEPREADDRVGYFMSVRKDWTVPHTDKTIFKRYINRWNFKKTDPAAEVSDVTADTQLVYYIEKTVPKQYRSYVREGILEWNKAFEQAGLRNAIQVRQQTENTFADLDPEDVRYNFFRWIVTGSAFAMGPSRANPFTGEIFDADIIMDDSMARYYVHQYEVYGPRALTGGFSDSKLEQFLETHPDDQLQTVHEHRYPEAANEWNVPERFNPVEAAQDLGRPTCEMAVGMVQQLALAAAANNQNGNRDLPEEFIGQAIKEVVMHEVGHTLGLRHNFKASSWLKLSEIKTASAGSRATTGSVMDYNSNTFAPAEIEQGQFITTTLGPYDYWAIEYGYRQATDKNQKEADLLKQITSRVAEAGLAYGTDEDSSILDPDPMVNKYDDGDDPIAFAEDRLKLAQRLRKDIADWAVEDGESYQRLRRAFDLLLGQQAAGARVVARLIGGQYIHRDHKGDPNGRPPFVVVPAEQQRKALAFLAQNVLSDSAFQFEPDLLNRLGPGRWGHWDSDAMDNIQEYEIHDRILGIQSFTLFQLMNPWTVNRVYDNMLKVAASEDLVSVPELFDTLAKTIWSELDEPSPSGTTNRKPAISSIRRNLQRAHLARLVQAVISQPGMSMNADCHAVARQALKNLGERISAKIDKSTGLDPYTMAHLSDSLERVRKALDAEFFAEGHGDSAGGTVIIFGQQQKNP